VHGHLDPPGGVTHEEVGDVVQAMADGTVYVAVRHNELVGAARVRAVDGPPGLYCGRLAVRGSAQRQGIGSALMAAVEQQARAEGYPALVVGVRVELPKNLQFFLHRGFHVHAEQCHPGYDRPTYLTLRKVLNPTAQAG